MAVKTTAQLHQKMMLAAWKATNLWNEMEGVIKNKEAKMKL